MNFSGMPWYGQIIMLIVLVLVAVFLFHEIVLPLIGKIT
jgi:hypothetical protein